MTSWNLHPENFYITCGLIGVFGTTLSFFSYLLKERLYIPEAMLCLLVGAAFSQGANFIRPQEYATGEFGVTTINLEFTRLVLSVQVFLAGVQLPARYVRQKWRPLLLILGPGMTLMWLMSSLLIWGLSKRTSFVESLIVGACITPTDPVLANTIIKGRFADDYMPLDLAHLIAAESGANDGLGFPFLYLGLWLYRAKLRANFSTSNAMELWFGDTWAYVVVLSVIWGAVAGYLSRKALKWCDHLRFVDRESFHAFPIFIVLALIGTCGLVGSDDVLSCFVAGNVLGWDNWFQEETLDDSSQPTIDMMLNQAVFLWFGAVCPWPDFATSGDVIGLGRLVALSILILLLRRIPVILALQKFLQPVHSSKYALLMGHFGPIGVSAIFYLSELILFLREEVEPDSGSSEEVSRLVQLAQVIVWFMLTSSVFVHGLSVPCFKTWQYVSFKIVGQKAIIPRPQGLRQRLDRKKQQYKHAKDRPTTYLPPQDEVENEPHAYTMGLPPKMPWRRLRRKPGKANHGHSHKDDHPPETGEIDRQQV